MNSRATCPSISEPPDARFDLLRAIAHHCTCEHDGSVTLSVCPSHAALTDRRFVSRMAFARSLSYRLVAEEWRVELPQGWRP